MRWLGLVIVTVRVPERLLILIEDLARKNKVSRSNLLTQLLVLGLREYAELQKQAAAVITCEYTGQDCNRP